MGKKLVDIGLKIDSSGVAFYKYLHLLLHEDIIAKLEHIKLKTDVYIFSGIIRNYFLHEYFKRDIDIVLSREIDIHIEFDGMPITKNSFGGYKILFPSGPLDLWFIKDTWAFHHSQKTLDFHLEKRIPSTAFFNCSSIIYSLNNQTFHYTDAFLKFLRTRELDYVYKDNPNYPLCIVNTFYYADRYKLKISERLADLIKNLNSKNSYDYEQMQLKHFGKIIYTNSVIQARL